MENKLNKLAAWRTLKSFLNGFNANEFMHITHTQCGQPQEHTEVRGRERAVWKLVGQQ